VQPGLFVLMFPVFYLTSAFSVLAVAAGVWICAVEWRERRAERLSGGAR
jgi:hypothetical protein